MAVVPPLLSDALADRYRIERELGHGGMATVYLAEDLKHHRQVAIKVLSPEIASLIGPERFLREIQIAARLSHPHVLPLHDSGEAAGILYYVMPFVDGESLRDRLVREGAMPIGDVLRVLRDVADALAHAHSLGVVHRDIKPENIMLAGRHALVTDFGVARALSEAGARDQFTTIGTLLGTPGYMAPEQAVADPDVDHRADIYAVGVLAYEMLAGRPPFVGATTQAVVAAQLHAEPEPIVRLRQGLPLPLAAAVMRCLEKRPDDRWSSANKLLAQLESLLTPSEGLTPVVRGVGWASRRRNRLVLALGVVAVLLGIGVVWVVPALRRSQQLDWVRGQAIPQIRDLAESGEWNAAYLLAVRARAIIPQDSVLASLWPRFSRYATIHSKPPGARVFRKDYSASDAEWLFLGTTPLDSIRLPIGFSRLRLEKQGFSTLNAAVLPSPILDPPFMFDVGESVPLGMARIPGGSLGVLLTGLEHIERLELKDFYMDIHEVTNRQFKAFVDSGGYERHEFWVEPFVLDGRRLSWEEAMARLRDRTGRPGPATWEVGDYTTGQADHPVLGVSWYEAAAYARFVGKQLPTIYAWSRAALTPASFWIVSHSNIEGQGPAPVGKHQGMGPYGTFDMAGNAREWCVNEAGGQRYILGGGWNDPTFAFNNPFAQPPFDRSPSNGFRLAQYPADDPNLVLASRPIDRVFRDFTREKPVSDPIFEVYRRLYDYDRTAINAVVEEADSSAEEWVREKVTFDAAYGRERVIAYLFLPKHGRPPYQVVVYFPGSSAIYDRSSRTALQTRTIDFVLRSGRAVIYPIYKGTYERGDGMRSQFADETNFYKEHVIAWAKDLQRSIDYLETRPDIDSARLAYYGFSWGGFMGGLMPAVETRIKVVVLYLAGLEFQRGRPEVEPFNFLPRVRVPVLMVNGRLDHRRPIQTSQIPMFNLLGTPKEQKRHVVYDGGHFVPRTQLISEVLDWLDRYLGPAR